MPQGIPWALGWYVRGQDKILISDELRMRLHFSDKQIRKKNSFVWDLSLQHTCEMFAGKETKPIWRLKVCTILYHWHNLCNAVSLFRHLCLKTTHVVIHWNKWCFPFVCSGRKSLCYEKMLRKMFTQQLKITQIIHSKCCHITWISKLKLSA